ncbi:hypothetical protein L226DRAFT_501974 [Lentinus tigrinus ALCF2SS1-7]|uniref:HIT-type domain-containing protein n=1 Tax=Lentinus tigrinus ALCF2SS1-6 TaxID=1328759 RepID=A0A5C2SV95_9APHY|nr:hypothetical protein L227DRAFT_518081 [Lentinus tigrinus ALCF2SS1-6]RPD79406.1 hypothetical protein L226DRAFT_501974 [Lentinus tigrinus ALCF2SS1-7]
MSTMESDEGPGEPVIASSSRETESVSTVPCAICRRQFSRYTCPRCNIPYCSLVCFRSEKHAECSESFYRKEVELDVKNAPSASGEEKRRMMDLLKRFEEDSLDDSPLLEDSGNDDDDDDDRDDLQRRLQNIDLDSASYDDLWNALTPAERDKFLRALQDPDNELAKQLASEAVEREQVEPWWQTSLEPSPEKWDNTVDRTSLRKHGTKPSIMALPEPLIKRSHDASASGPLLLYNICALCIAYAYAIRHFAIPSLSSLLAEDPDRLEIRRSVSQLVPFLVDRKSTTVHTSLSGVVTDLWSRFPPGHMDSKFFSLLLQDTAHLLRPAKMAVISSASDDPGQNLEDHRSANALRVLSDLAVLFGERGTTNINAKPNHVVHKLMFYAAYVLSTPAPMLRVLADEATLRAKTLESESARAGFSSGRASVRRVQPDAGGPRIEEL